MKKTLWCLLAVIGWGAAAYLCYHYLGLEKTSLIVGIVGAGATIAAVILAGPSNPGPAAPGITTTIHTEGSNSPGVVGRDYVVNSSGAPVREKK